LDGFRSQRNPSYDLSRSAILESEGRDEKQFSTDAETPVSGIIRLLYAVFG
jgi:hypothetical protein